MLERFLYKCVNQGYQVFGSGIFFLFQQVAWLARCQARRGRSWRTRRLVEKVSLLIQKGNAALWNNRVPEDHADPNLYL